MAIDASVGTTTANSYVTEAEADAYFEDRYRADKWNTVVNKEAILITSSRLLDWGLVFNGQKVSGSQSMQFPRVGIALDEDYTVPSETIPDQIKMAVFELALYSIEQERTLDNPLAGIGSVTVGPLNIQSPSSMMNNPRNPVIPDHVRKLLHLFISAGIGFIRLGRA